MADITLKPSDIIRGMSTTTDLADGGFSPSSYGLNLQKNRGFIDFIESATDRGGARS